MDRGPNLAPVLFVQAPSYGIPAIEKGVGLLAEAGLTLRNVLLDKKGKECWPDDGVDTVPNARAVFLAVKDAKDFLTVARWQCLMSMVADGGRLRDSLSLRDL